MQINFSNDSYECQYPWAEDTHIQGGCSGLVLSKSGNYNTAYFEAFPRNPNTFIRGEGETLAEAETKAWNHLQKTQACSGHEFERRGYTNGVGFCKHCNLYMSKVFEPSTLCVRCGIPTCHASHGEDILCEKCYGGIKIGELDPLMVTYYEGMLQDQYNPLLTAAEAKVLLEPIRRQLRADIAAARKTS